MSVLHLSDSSKWVVMLHFQVHRPPASDSSNSDVDACIFFNKDRTNSVCSYCKAGGSCFPATLELERSKTAQSGVSATWIAKVQSAGVASAATPQLGPHFGSGMDTAGRFTFSYLGALIAAGNVVAQTEDTDFQAA